MIFSTSSRFEKPEKGGTTQYSSIDAKYDSIGPKYINDWASPRPKVDNRSELNAVFDLVHPAPPTSPWGSSKSHRTCEPSLPPDKFHPYVPGPGDYSPRHESLLRSTFNKKKISPPRAKIISPQGRRTVPTPSMTSSNEDRKQNLSLLKKIIADVDEFSIRCDDFREQEPSS